MSYNEQLKNKIDLSLPFQRVGDFPIDKSSIFDSYVDALEYAKQTGEDKRQLGGSAYIGQIIVTTAINNVTAYVIANIGDNASLIKLASTEATGDLSADIQALKDSLNNLDTRISNLENAEKVIDTDTTYKFETGTNIDGTIKITSFNKNGVPISNPVEVQIKGWDALANLASGRSKAFVYKNKEDTQFKEDLKKKSFYNIGDLIYFTDLNIADEWVSEIFDSLNNNESYYGFSILETQHPDLSNYITSTEIENTYAKKDDLATVQLSLNNQISSINSSLEDKADKEELNNLNSEIDSIKNTIDNIDVSAQIEAKLDAIDVDQIGDDSTYIKYIKQENGKIDAIAEKFPNFNESIEEKSQEILKESKSYTDNKIGDLKENSTVVEYVDDKVATLESQIKNESSNIEALSDRVQLLSEDQVKINESISTIDAKVSANTNDINNLKSRVTSIEDSINNGLSPRVTALEKTLGEHTQKLANLEGAISSRVKEIHLGDTIYSPVDGIIKIPSISTDLLSQGEKRLVLDCLDLELKNNI